MIRALTAPASPAQAPAAAMKKVNVLTVRAHMMNLLRIRSQRVALSWARTRRPATILCSDILCGRYCKPAGLFGLGIPPALGDPHSIRRGTVGGRIRLRWASIAEVEDAGATPAASVIIALHVLASRFPARYHH